MLIVLGDLLQSLNEKVFLYVKVDIFILEEEGCFCFRRVFAKGK